MSGLTGNNILAGSSGQGGYEIEQSLRFNDNDAPYLSKTFASSSNRKTWTLSFWTKRGNVSLASNVGIMECGDQIGTNETEIIFGTGNDFFIYGKTSNTGTIDVRTTQVFRDVSAWYHIVLVVDTTSATSTITGSSTDRVRIYVNGSQVTNISAPIVPALNSDHWINSNTYAHNINKFRTNYYDGYLAEYYFIDGQALDPSNFGETDLLTNQWIPKKYVGTYGTNGFYLNFSNSASLGADSSGNGNNFTPTNLAATDQVLDSPTNNFATLNPLAPDTTGSTAHSFSEGNLKVSTSSNNWWNAFGTIGLPSGKWYFEYCAVGSGTVDQNVGVTVSDWYRGSGGGIDTAGAYSLYTSSGGVGLLYTDGSYVNNGSSWAWTWGDIVNFAIDVDTGKIWYGINGTWLGSGNPASGTNQAHTVSATNLAKTLLPAFSGYHTGGTPVINFGQDSSFAGSKTAQNNKDANGKGDFYYAPPSGYLALCEDNLPDPSIALPGDHFNTLLYTGLYGTSDSYTGVGFQPDFTWLKHRNNPTAYGHQLYDSVRGATNYLISNTSAAENDGGAPFTLGLQSFDSDGFTLGQTLTINASGVNHVAWNWKADNTSGSSNTDGTITSTVSANPTAGFSIVKYTGNATAGATVGHGLSQAPDFMLVKQLDAVKNWSVYYGDPTDYLILNSQNATADDNRFWNDTSPGASVFTLGSLDWVNASGNDYIAYCFHSVEGYSKVGSYIGNGNANGTFVYLGFRAAFVLFKSTAAGDSWTILDNQRDPYNKMDTSLFPNLASADTTQTNNECDFLSNGVKIRNSLSRLNGNGITYIYMAFAESPFKYSNAR